LTFFSYYIRIGFLVTTINILVLSRKAYFYALCSMLVKVPCVNVQFQVVGLSHLMSRGTDMSSVMLPRGHIIVSTLGAAICAMVSTY
jgi:hypothetical protein